MAKPKLSTHEKLPIVYHAPTRRMFLGELGTFLLAIPLLPSLIPRMAHAATEHDFRRAVFLANGHGSLSLDFDPSNVNYTQQARNLRVGSLANAQLGASFPTSYNSLRGKMTLLRGLDLSDAWGHTNTTFLCASGRGGPINDHRGFISRIPESMDTILSKKIYQGGSPIRILRVGAFGRATHSFENYTRLDGVTSVQALFNLVSQNIVVPDSSGGAPQYTDRDLANLKKKKIVDYALRSIQKVSKSSELSANEKPIFDNYTSLLSQLQQDIHVAQPGGGGADPATSNFACGDFRVGAESNNSQQRARQMCDIVVAAMACGVTRLATMSLPAEHYYVHRLHDQGSRTLHAQYLRDNVMPTAAYLMSLMDSIEDSNGKTMLENSCVLQTSDMASSHFPNHHGANFPVLVGGGLNGKLRMGSVIDYQDRNALLEGFPNGWAGGYYGGRPYNELLITIMKSFGLQQSDYSHNGSTGFGAYDNRHTGAPGTTKKVAAYMSDVYLNENRDRDKTLDYFYLG